MVGDSSAPGILGKQRDFRGPSLILGATQHAGLIRIAMLLSSSRKWPFCLNQLACWKANARPVHSAAQSFHV